MSPIRSGFQRLAGATIQGFQPYVCPPSIKTVFSTPLAMTSDSEQYPWIQFTNPTSQLPRLAPRPHGKGRSLPTPPGPPTRHTMRSTATQDPRIRARAAASKRSQDEDFVTSLLSLSLVEKAHTLPVPKPSTSANGTIQGSQIGQAGMSSDGRPNGDVSPKLPNSTPLFAPVPVKAWVAPTLLAHPRNRERHHAKELYTPYNKSRASIKERISASTESTASGASNHVPKHRTKQPTKSILRKSNSHKDGDDSGNSLGEACLAGSASGSNADASETHDAPRAKTLEEQVFGGGSDLEDEDEAVLPASIDKGKGKAVDPAERGKAAQECGSLEEANREDGRKEQPEKCASPPLPARTSPVIPPPTSRTPETPAAIPAPIPQRDTKHRVPSPAPPSLSLPPLMMPTSFPTSFAFAPHYVPVDIYRESEENSWENWDYMELDGDWEMTDVSGGVCRTWRWTWDFCRVQQRYIYGLFGY